MSREMIEADWKRFRELRPTALNRFCGRLLAEVWRMAGASERSNHQRFLDLFELINRRNRELADAFDEARRSTAVLQLARMRAEGLLTDEEFESFSPETRQPVEGLLALRET